MSRCVSLSPKQLLLVDISVVEMQSGATTAPGSGSKHPELEQLFEVFEVREWGGNGFREMINMNFKNISILQKMLVVSELV